MKTKTEEQRTAIAAGQLDEIISLIQRESFFRLLRDYGWRVGYDINSNAYIFELPEEWG